MEPTGVEGEAGALGLKGHASTLLCIDGRADLDGNADMDDSPGIGAGGTDISTPKNTEALALVTASSLTASSLFDQIVSRSVGLRPR